MYLTYKVTAIKNYEIYIDQWIDHEALSCKKPTANYLKQKKKGIYLLMKFQSTMTVKLQAELDQGSSFNLLQFSGFWAPVYVRLVFRLPSLMLV